MIQNNPGGKKTFTVLVTFVALSLIYFIFTFNRYYHKHSSLPVKNVSDTKYVLYWNPFWTRADYYIGHGYKPFENCKYTNCYATDNRSLVPLRYFNALIFHSESYNKEKHGTPMHRFLHQKYIFMNMETPPHTRVDLKSYNSYFNWTMSYRYDSDIVRRHGSFFKTDTNYSMSVAKHLTAGKTKLAAWFVSNCNTSSHREILTNAIQRQMGVDVFGKCGPLQCERRKDEPRQSGTECYSMLEQNYKFYFSFENSYCKDYSTEKLYNILQRDVVPVVYGGSDYSVSAPPNSVINVEKFKSITHLVQYLQYLDKHANMYLQYFKWKRHYILTSSMEPSACLLCQKLNEDKDETVYHNLEDWWRGANSTVCKLGKNLPKIVSDLVK